MAPPPPPSQAGKFKPRKPPPKKPSAGSSVVITPGISSSSNAAPSTSGATGSPTNKESTGSNSSGRGGRGGSGNARGRGGRGRGGRMPIPQGRVFFTGIEAQQQQQQKSSGPTKAGVLGSNSSKSKEGEEIIVGEISGDGVGAAAIARAAAGGGSDGGRFYDDDRWSGPYDNETATSANLPPTAYTYESSSDDEPDEILKKLPQSKNRFPTNMPISICPPNATGTTTTTTKMSTQVEEDVTSQLDKLHQEQDPPMTSPFVEGNLSPMSSPWILFKFPTRLPRIHPRCTISTKQESDEQPRPDALVSSSSIPDEATSQDEMMMLEDDNTKFLSNLSSVTSYDNTLKDISAGHYGKLLVYKSGKTVLVLGSPDQPTGNVRMLVMDGIHPSFQQQVVCIDPKDKTFIPLGEVQKTAVVIPDIDEAFI